MTHSLTLSHTHSQTVETRGRVDDFKSGRGSRGVVEGRTVDMRCEVSHSLRVP